MYIHSGRYFKPRESGRKGCVLAVRLPKGRHAINYRRAETYALCTAVVVHCFLLPLPSTALPQVPGTKYFCVVALWPQSLYLSRIKNHHGHGVCWVSTDRKKGLTWNHTHINHMASEIILYLRYELVQARRPNFCQPRMPLAISTRISHICYPGIILTAMNSGTGWHSQIFCWSPSAGASGENLCRPTRAFKKVSHGQVFP